MGWATDVSYNSGQLKFSIRDKKGTAIQAGAVDAVIGRPTTDEDDQRVAFVLNDGAYIATITLDTGMWMLKINAVSRGGDLFTQRFDIWVN